MALSFSLLSPFPSPSILALPTTPRNYHSFTLPNFSLSLFSSHFSPSLSASTLHLSLPSKPFTGVRLSAPHRNKHSLIVSAAAAEGEASASSAAEEGLPPSVDKLPLESKVKEREEQRARMKLAKKIRLRRKRLLRKRRLRKKGRWPPSKMKKLKNV